MVENILNNELKAQLILKEYLSEPSNIYNTLSGKRLQILSPGRINKFEGPDFLDMAVLINGDVIIGNSEFHLKSSDWDNHNHTENQNYKNLLLHIVLDNNKEITNDNFLDTLVIDKTKFNEFVSHFENKQKIEEDKFRNKSELISIIEDLQHFSLMRLIRKTEEIQNILNNNEFESAFKIVIEKFIDNYSSKRRRPVYDKEGFEKIINDSLKSDAFNFIKEISKHQNIIPLENNNLGGKKPLIRSNSTKTNRDLELEDDFDFENEFENEFEDDFEKIDFQDLDYQNEGNNELSINSNKFIILDILQSLLKKKFSDEGYNLRKEIIINCIVPMAICVSNEQDRISIFSWYWSTPSLNNYGILKRKFPTIGQNYIWQQQGMLEYIKEQGKKSNVIQDFFHNNNISEVLSFYKLATFSRNKFDDY